MKLTDLKKGVGQYLGAAAATADGDKRSALAPFGPDYRCEPTDYPPSPRSANGRRASPARCRTSRSAIREAGGGHRRRRSRRRSSSPRRSSTTSSTTRASSCSSRGRARSCSSPATPRPATGSTGSTIWTSRRRRPSARSCAQEGSDILGSLDFYKVGHHGSTNATPDLRGRGDGRRTSSRCARHRTDTFGSVANESEVPRIPLLDALGEEERARAQRSLRRSITTGRRFQRSPAHPRRCRKPARGGRFVVGLLLRGLPAVMMAPSGDERRVHTRRRSAADRVPEREPRIALEHARTDVAASDAPRSRSASRHAEPPVFRPLKVYAFGPSLGRTPGNVDTITGALREARGRARSASASPSSTTTRAGTASTTPSISTIR